MNLTDDEIKLAYEERLADDLRNRQDMGRRTKLQTIYKELCWAGPHCPHCHPTNSNPF